MPAFDREEAEKLREAIERSRRAMENVGGTDLEAIVAETAYDYWPQRAVLARARWRVAERAGAHPELAAIGAEERTALVAAIGRTQESLRGGSVDLEAIAAEGSRNYWAERRRLTEETAPRHIESDAILGMTRILDRAARELFPHRERRKPWRDVVYNAAAVLAPLLVITPLLVSAYQGDFFHPSLVRSWRTISASFFDTGFAVGTFVVILIGGGLLWSALRNPETRRRVTQFGGAATASAVVAVVVAAYLNSSRTASSLDRLQANVTARLLLALERSDAGHLVLPDQVYGSMMFETKSFSPYLATLHAWTPGSKGEIRVRLQPQSADYSWFVDGRQIPKGRLAIGRVTACDTDTCSITLADGTRTTTLSSVAGERLPIGSRVAAEIGVDNRIANVVTLSPISTSPAPQQDNR